MRRIVAWTLALVFTSALMAGGKVKLNVKTGLWQTTITNTVTGSMGLPPEIAARLTPAQRARFEAAQKKQGMRMNWRLLTQPEGEAAAAI